MNTALQNVTNKDEFLTEWNTFIEEVGREPSVDEILDKSGIAVHWLRKYNMGAMIAKFTLGSLAYVANPDWRHERAYGNSIIEKISEAHHIHSNTLREARRCAEFFGMDLRLYHKWLTEGDNVKNWKDVIRLIRAYSDPEVHGPEKLSEILAKQVERAGDTIQELREHAHEGMIDRETVEGVEESFLQNIQSWEDDEEAQDEVFTDEAPETPRDEKYLEFIRTKNCAACGTYGVHAHHVEQMRTGKKGSDYSAIPLCEECHNIVEGAERGGHRKLENEKMFSVSQTISRCQHEYFTGEPLKLPGDLTRGLKNFV